MIIPENDPNGLKILGIDGWTGSMFMIPRKSLKDIENREEVNQPGIYFLFGESDKSTKQSLYIGESESFFGRLERHNLKRDFWNLAIVFTGGLDRADVKYLENKSTILSKKAGRYEVLNKVQPQENRLSQFKKISVDDFFNRVEYLLAVFGYPIFDSAFESSKEGDLYKISIEGLVATGKLLDNGDFLVFKNSQARLRETNSFIGGFSYGARRTFLKEGKLLEKEGAYLFTQDIIFKSPSAAAATIKGRSTNGWTSWKDKNGKTLDENLRKK